VEPAAALVAGGAERTRVGTVEAAGGSLVLKSFVGHTFSYDDDTSAAADGDGDGGGGGAGAPQRVTIEVEAEPPTADGAPGGGFYVLGASLAPPIVVACGTTKGAIRLQASDVT